MQMHNYETLKMGASLTCSSKSHENSMAGAGPGWGVAGTDRGGWNMAKEEQVMGADSVGIMRILRGRMT